MISRYTHQGLTWIDLESPSSEEVRHIAEEFSLPNLVTQEMSTLMLRSKVDSYPDFMYLVLHFPMLAGHSDNTEQEVDFIIGKEFIITIRYEQVAAISEFAQVFEKASLGGGEHQMTHGGFVFTQLMKVFYSRLLNDLEDITTIIKDVEYSIFSAQESSTVRRLSTISRTLLDFKQAVHFHRDILLSYQTAGARLFGNGYVHAAENIVSEFNKVSNVLENHRDVLMELQRTNDSLLSTRSNEIMKTFTVMTFIMLPLTLITSIFSMNTPSDFVFIRTAQDFYFVLGAMLLTGLIMFLFFKLRKWL